MKVLITGASGRLAPFLIRELQDDYELVLASRTPPNEEFARHKWVQADLNDFEACRRAVQGVQAIQHLGAQPNPTDHPNLQNSEKPFDATFKTNMLGTYYLMQAALEEKVRAVVLCGSNCALGHGFNINGQEFPLEYLPIDEEHPCHPQDSYSYSKNAGEQLMAMYARAYGVRTSVTRPAGIRSPKERAQMKRSAKPAAGWNPWLWCWVGSEDVASAHRLLMEAADELPPYGAYFVNGDDTAALEDSAELVERFRPKLKPLAENLQGTQSFIRCDKIKRAVGWKHASSWRDAS